MADDSRWPEPPDTDDVIQQLGRYRPDDPPLSLPDLIERDTLDLELAAWLVSRISRGASYIVGAGPGGVGKTTTMRAFLSFVPGDRDLVIARRESIVVPDNGLACVISHELSDHPPPDYLWGQNLRDFFVLSERGHSLVGNMHVDDIQEARAEICDANDVPEGQFRAIDLFIFVKVEGMDPSVGRIHDTTSRRYFGEIQFSDGSSAHRSIYTPGGGLHADAPRDAEHETSCRSFLEDALSRSDRDITRLRERFSAWEN